MCDDAIKTSSNFVNEDAGCNEADGTDDEGGLIGAPIVAVGVALNTGV